MDNFFAPVWDHGQILYARRQGADAVAIQVHHAVCDGFQVGRMLMNYNSTAMSGRAGRNWYVDVRTRLQIIHNLMYHTHTQETAMTISSS